MKISHVIILLLAAQMFLFGCGTTQSQIPFSEETPRNDHDVIIYVYRLSSIVGAAAPWNVRIDGENVGVLNQGAYMPLHIAPGTHTLKVGESSPYVLDRVIVETLADNPNVFIAEKNEIYYIRCEGFTVEFVPKQKAMTELSSMKYDMGL
jgi:hypothetical protein